MPGSPPLSGSGARADVAIAGALFVGTAAFVFNLPWFLGGDEGYYLYESARLLDGAVFYRDLFDLITPGSHWLLAGLFGAFGTTMATARGLHAVTQGLIVVLVWTGCRLLGVRRGVAIAAALMQPALFEPAWQCTSPHWLATLLTLAVLVALLRDPATAALPGMLVGLLIAVQQQKGVVIGAGAAAAIVAGRLAAGGRGAAPAIVRQLARYLAGLLAVVVPFGIALLWSVGLQPLWTALVVFPFVNYPRVNRVPWGYAGMLPTYTFPRLLVWLPAVILVEAARSIRSGEAEERRRGATLVVMAAAAVGSIAYNPDYIHHAFVGSVFAVVLGDVVEAGLRALAPRIVATAVTALALLALASQLGLVMARAHRDFPIDVATPFGTVQFHGTPEATAYARIAALTRAAPRAELFSYPWGGAVHLLTGTINPTPIQIYLPTYTTAGQIADTLATLERRRVPWVVTPSPLDPKDPIQAYVAEHYEQVVENGRALPLFRRRE